ncbi:MAG: phospholipase D-like domain-containing protein [Bradymonadaceae bacterium]
MLRNHLHLLVLTLLISLAACQAEEIEAELDHDELASEVYEEGPPLLGEDGKEDRFGAGLLAYAELPMDADFDAPLQVLFAPDDPVTTLEITMIERVKFARQTDERTFGDGENPYKIRYAAYNLRNPDILEKLGDAHEAGVDVRVLIEARQLDPEKPWNIADTYLAERGFEIYPDQRELSAAEKDRPGSLIGIRGPGLMHFKTRLFETPEGTSLLTGSLNPGDNAVLNEETLHLITDEHVVARYQDAYERILHGQAFENEWHGERAVNVLFTPSSRGMRAGTQILRWLEEEQEQILIMVFSLRNLTADGIDGSLVDILGAKVRQGVPVYVITDRKQSDGVDANGNRLMWDDPTEDLLRAAGVPVYEAINYAGEFNAMHHKVAVLGKTRTRVITDASNWTLAGLGGKGRPAKNLESVLFIDSKRLDDNRTGRRYIAQWARVLSRYADQSVEVDGERPFDAVYADLTASPLWPSQDVHFTARAQTEFGESVRAVGNTPELGNWDEGPGVELLTDYHNYPHWRTRAPTPMPLGLSFEWKLIARHADTGAVRWEGGDNRDGFVQSGALVPDPHVDLSAEWR